MLPGTFDDCGCCGARAADNAINALRITRKTMSPLNVLCVFIDGRYMQFAVSALADDDGKGGRIETIALLQHPYVMPPLLFANFGAAREHFKPAVVDS